MHELKRWNCALITGASSGIGEQLARLLAGSVDHLVLVARRAERMERLSRELKSLYPQLRMWVMSADLTSVEHRQHLINELAANNLQVDLLINNAGMGDYGDFLSADWAKIEQMLELNITALTHLSHALLPGIVKQQGAIVNLSSLAGSFPIPDFAAYAASKAYVTSLSESLAIELKEHDVRVVCVCPGPVRTEFGKVARRGKHDKAPHSNQAWYYVPVEQVAKEVLQALHGGKLRVYPGWQHKLLALGLALTPLMLLRVVLATRPRRTH